jgi:myo-inositol-1(or 4)-monophosphatase
VIGTGFPSRSVDQLDEFIGYFRRLTLEGAGLRRPGAAALDLAYVAAGRFDAFFEIGLSPWDVAGGALLVTEAGGLVGDFQGESEHLFGGRVLAANPVLFAAMIQRLKPG